MEETAAKQRQREEEAEARRQERKAGDSSARPSRTLERGPERILERAPLRGEASPAVAAPVIPVKAGGWRDRLAAKERGEEPARDVSASPAPNARAPASPAVTSARPVGTGPGYIPPYLRKGDQGTGSRSPADENRDRDRTQSPATNGARVGMDSAPAGGRYRPGAFKRTGGT